MPTMVFDFFSLCNGLYRILSAFGVRETFCDLPIDNARSRAKVISFKET